MSVDSVAYFEERVREFHLEEHLEKFRALGWTSLACLAYASDYVPGVSEGAIFNREIAEVAFPGVESHPDKHLLRRLYVEAYSLATWELRRKCESTEDDAPRRLPPAERNSRRDRVARRLPGLKIEGELDPSHRLQDLAFAIWDSNVVSHVTWESATKRDAELQGSKADTAWRVDSSGFLKQSSEREPSRADLRSDLPLQCALRRRSIAFEMADLASYESMELVTNLFVRELMRDAPPGFSKVSLDQLLRADRELLFELSHRCRTGVRRMPDGRRPFDVQIPLIIDSPQFRYLLMPLPGGASSKAQNPSDSGGRKDTNPKKRSPLEQSNADLKAEIKQLKAARNGAADKAPDGGGGGGKGGGKGKKGRSPKVPSGVVGKNFQTSHGEPICFAHDLSNGCDQAKAGGRCPRGPHVCAEPGCSATHSLQQHADQ